jgi:MYXO-CTERM domain-containing protein
MKWYAQYKLLVEDNICRNAIGQSDSEGLALKGGIIERATVRGNVIHDVHQHGIGGNQHILVESEILHNRVYNCAGNCAYFNQDGLIDSAIHIYRNSFIGRVQIDDVGAVAGGVFRFSNNVHVTDDPLDRYFPGTRYVGDGIVDAAQLQVSAAPNEDLVRAPADNCVDATGLLSDLGPDACRTNYLGLKGAELGPSGSGGGDPGSSSSGSGAADSGVGGGGASASTGSGSSNGATSGDPGEPGDGTDDGGCACSSTGRGAPTSALGAVLLLLAAVGRRRRRN